MKLYCIYCEKEARYLFEGTSLCKEHLHKALKARESPEPLVVLDSPEVPE